jgi:DNA-binding CsgD family transcriptional regulator
MTSNVDFAEVNKRLGVVIALLLRNLPAEKEGLSLRDQVELLAGLGMRPKDIADILGKTQGYVSKELVSLRKKGNKTK